MKVSELIKELNEILEREGDLEIIYENDECDKYDFILEERIKLEYTSLHYDLYSDNYYYFNTDGEKRLVIQ